VSVATSNFYRRNENLWLKWRGEREREREREKEKYRLTKSPSKTGYLT
jgi:hypothetical protein